MLVINDERFFKRAEIIWEKGTNRAEFFRGEVNKYEWVDIGSSFLPSDILAAFLYAQCESIDEIQIKRKLLWNAYFNGLKSVSDNDCIKLPVIPEYATNNAHMFYIVCNSSEIRNNLIAYLKEKQIHTVFHYLSLHSSPFYSAKHDGRIIPFSEKYSDCILRLPFYYELSIEEVNLICKELHRFFIQ
jgi:dTDP-4-amino-4,6-dideoxygalactose transaminase